MTMNIMRGVTLAIAGACMSLSLSACGTTGTGFKATDYGTTGPISAEESAVSHTRNYMVDTLVGYDENGHRNPSRELTMDESILVAEADRYCAIKVEQVDGLLGEYAGNVSLFAILGAVGQAAGSLGVPGADLASYAYLGAGSFGASGALTTRIMIKQGLVILHSSCMQAEVKSDPRGRRLGIYPILMGEARRPGVSNGHSTSLQDWSNDLPDEDVSSNLPFTPIPM